MEEIEITPYIWYVISSIEVFNYQSTVQSPGFVDTLKGLLLLKYYSWNTSWQQDKIKIVWSVWTL